MLNEEFSRNEPSIDSDIRDERITARRIRIERRKEVDKKANFQANEAEVEKLKEEISNTRKQLKESHKLLVKLRSEGIDIVTNVKTDGDGVEIERRATEEEANKLRREKVHQENEITLDRLEELNQQWEVALSKTLAYDLNEMLQIQKKACDLILEDKNKLISEFRNDLKEKDKQYVEELKRQAADIELLIERMNSQVQLLAKAYKVELKHIEAIFIEERNSMLAEMNEEWKKLLKERRQKEDDYLKNRAEQVELHEKQINQQRTHDSEEYNKTKIKLEQDIQLVQQQIQEMRATYQLNQEKLEYNFQVLRKRDEENLITKSVQKKRITQIFVSESEKLFDSLHDILTNQKKKNIQQEDSYAMENIHLTQEFEHLVARYENFLKKSKLTMENNASQFSSLWIMNEEECKKLAKKLLKIDQILHEQQLGLPWISPDLEFMENIGPIGKKTSLNVKGNQLNKKHLVSVGCGPAEVNKSSLSSGKFSELVTNEVEEKAEKMPFEEDYFYEPIQEVDKCLDRVPNHLVKHIFKLICNETGFLIEDKVWELLNTLEMNEQTLMKLDSVLDVMQINNEEDIKNLSLYFLKKSTKHEMLYKDQEVKIVGGDEISLEQDEMNSVATRDSKYITPYPSYTKLTSTYEGAHVFEPSEAQIGDVTGDEVFIHPNDVLLALKAFVADHQTKSKPCSVRMNTADYSEFEMKIEDVEICKKEPAKDIMENTMTSLPKPNIKDILTKHELIKAYDECDIHVNDRDDTEDAKYWMNYLQIIDNEKQALWGAMAKHFEDYYKVLTRRSKLLDDRAGLIAQNKELQVLLQHCICKTDEK